MFTGQTKKVVIGVLALFSLLFVALFSFSDFEYPSTELDEDQSPQEEEKALENTDEDTFTTSPNTNPATTTTTTPTVGNN
jgi:hypothetical protein